MTSEDRSQQRRQAQRQGRRSEQNRRLQVIETQSDQSRAARLQSGAIPQRSDEAHGTSSQPLQAQRRSSQAETTQPQSRQGQVRPRPNSPQAAQLQPHPAAPPPQQPLGQPQNTPSQSHLGPPLSGPPLQATNAHAQPPPLSTLQQYLRPASPTITPANFPQLSVEQYNRLMDCARYFPTLTHNLQSLGLLSAAETRNLRLPTTCTDWTSLLDDLDRMLRFYQQHRNPQVEALRAWQSSPARDVIWMLRRFAAELPP